MTTEHTPSHVENTLVKCLEILEAQEKLFHPIDNEYTTSDGCQIISSIKSAIGIVRHEAVQLPRSVWEAQMMQTVAGMYLKDVKP